MPISRQVACWAATSRYKLEPYGCLALEMYGANLEHGDKLHAFIRLGSRGCCQSAVDIVMQHLYKYCRAMDSERLMEHVAPY